MKAGITILSAMALSIAVAPASAQDVTGVVVTSSQYVSGGVTAADPRYLGKDSAGRLIVLNHNASNNAAFALLRVDVSGPVPSFTTLATGAQLAAAVTNLGGTPPAAITIRGMAVAANDTVVLASDDASSAYLFTVTAPGTVGVLAGLQTDSAVDGANGLACVGNTACVLVENSFDATAGTDHVQAFDVTATANGLQNGVEVASEANILAAIAGATQASVRLNLGVGTAANTLLLANSGNAGATDELLSVNIGTGAVTLAKSRAAMIADLAESELGYGSIAYDAPSNSVYLYANFGGTAADDDVLKVTNGGTGTASVFATDTAVEADTDFTSNGGTFFNVSNLGLAVSGTNLIWNDFTAKATYKMALGASSVNDWTLY